MRLLLRNIISAFIGFAMPGFLHAAATSVA